MKNFIFATIIGVLLLTGSLSYAQDKTGTEFFSSFPMISHTTKKVAMCYDEPAVIFDYMNEVGMSPVATGNDISESGVALFATKDHKYFMILSILSSVSGARPAMTCVLFGGTDLKINMGNLGDPS